MSINRARRYRYSFDVAPTPRSRVHPIGTKVGHVTVIAIAYNSDLSQFEYQCQCVCGNIGIWCKGDIDRAMKHQTICCGCRRGERIRKMKIRHGHAYTPTWRSWMSMLDRCSKKTGNKHRMRYVSRGIKVCERWQTFENFLADMGERPPGTSLDRINNDGHYEPGNCRWATSTEQSRNRGSFVRLFEFQGESLPLEPWAKRYGMSRTTLKRRLANGWSMEKALTIPRRSGLVRTDIT